MKKFKGSVEVLKVAGLPSYLKSLAYKLDIDLTVDVDKHWIYETVYFHGSGEESKVDQFEYCLKRDMNEYAES